MKFNEVSTNILIHCNSRRYSVLGHPNRLKTLEIYTTGLLLMGIHNFLYIFIWCGEEYNNFNQIANLSLHIYLTISFLLSLSSLLPLSLFKVCNKVLTVCSYKKRHSFSTAEVYSKFAIFYFIIHAVIINISDI